MPCFAPQEQPKLPSNHCKSLPALIRDACAPCHGSCIRTLSSLSCQVEIPDDDLDNKRVENYIFKFLMDSIDLAASYVTSFSFLGSHVVSDFHVPQVIILEIQKRALKAKSRPKDLMSLFPTGRAIIAPNEKRDGEEERGADDGEESEAFFSAKSSFSSCSSDGRSELQEHRGRVVPKEIKHCDGWPFGLCRRGSLLPPLPSVPSDSWMWYKRNLVTRDKEWSGLVNF